MPSASVWNANEMAGKTRGLGCFGGEHTAVWMNKELLGYQIQIGVR